MYVPLLFYYFLFNWGDKIIKLLVNFKTNDEAFSKIDNKI